MKRWIGIGGTKWNRWLVRYPLLRHQGGGSAEIALQMAAAGAMVLVTEVGASLDGTGADASRGQKVVDQIRSYGGQAELNSGSVADSAAARSMVDQAIERCAQLDIVVNNAGILRDSISHKMSDEDWDAVIKVQLYDTFNVGRAFQLIL